MAERHRGRTDFFSVLVSWNGYVPFLVALFVEENKWIRNPAYSRNSGIAISMSWSIDVKSFWNNSIHTVTNRQTYRKCMHSTKCIYNMILKWTFWKSIQYHALKFNSRFKWLCTKHNNYELIEDMKRYIYFQRVIWPGVWCF